MKGELMLVLMCLLPISSQAAIFWDDELESGNTGYSLPGGGGMSWDTSVKYSGSGSLRYNFGAECYPDAAAQSNCGGFMDRTFTSTTDFYRRVYFRMSAGFTVSDIFTKMFRSDTDDGNFSNWWTMGCCGSKEFAVHNQNVPFGDTTVESTGFEFEDATWYCIETREKMSTPGVADGILTVWIDGVQVMHQTNIPYRESGDNQEFVSNRMYRQTGIGNLWFDRLAVGNTRIGCLEEEEDDPIVLFLSDKGHLQKQKKTH